MRNVLSRMKEINTGYAELQKVKHDPHALVALLDRTRTEGAPEDLQAMVVTSTHRHKGNDEIMQALERTLHENDHWRVRSAVTVALGEIGTPRAIDLLRQAQSDSSKKVRHNAQHTLRGLESGILPITARQ